MSAIAEIPVNVAVVQESSVFLNRAASVEKTIALATEAADNGAQLVLFPEAFIPGYPRGLSFGAIVGSRSAAGRKLFRRYAENAITIPGPEAEQLAETAAALEIYLAVGVIEREARSSGTLYCTLVLWGPDGELLNVHRKIKPTASERLIWGEGDGSGLRAVPTEFGNIGGLICWENYMPLARAALFNQGLEIYLAPTADGRESWQATIRHIAMEGRCFVLACNQFVTKADYPNDLDAASKKELADLSDPLSRGGSAIIGPLGEYLAGPLWDEAGILYAELDLGALTEARFDFDVAGHYSRPDLFHLAAPYDPDLAGGATAQELAMLGEALFAGGPPPGLFSPFAFPQDESYFGPPEDDPFYDSLPAVFSTPPTGGINLPKESKATKPQRRRRR